MLVEVVAAELLRVSSQPRPRNELSYATLLAGQEENLAEVVDCTSSAFGASRIVSESSSRSVSRALPKNLACLSSAAITS